MVRFKKEVIEQLLDDRKENLNPTTYQHIRKTIEQGANKLDAYALSNLCRDLKCLPSDIVEAV